MLCPLHLKTPASHSDIVSSLPFTSTQMLYPASWHSEASLQTHLLFWAGRTSGRDLMAHCERGRLKAHHRQTNGMVIREPLSWVRQQTLCWKGRKTRKWGYFVSLGINGLWNWCQAFYWLDTSEAGLSKSRVLPLFPHMGSKPCGPEIKDNSLFPRSNKKVSAESGGKIKAQRHRKKRRKSSLREKVWHWEGHLSYKN